MSKLRRTERLTLLTGRLLARPGELFSLGDFAAELGAAKSSLSEDLSLVNEALQQLGVGRIETVTGAAGGARYLPAMTAEAVRDLAAQICARLMEPERILPGGFLYLTDLLFHPALAAAVGTAFATRFSAVRPQAVLTVETKGIPLALMTARSLGVPLVVARHDSRPSDGPAVSINYVSGSSGRVSSMALPRRALAPGARVLIVDDFMKGGGTALGLMDLVREVGGEVAGVAVLVATAEPERKLAERFDALVVLAEHSHGGPRFTAEPAAWVQGLGQPGDATGGSEAGGGSTSQ
ncbi:MAG: pur operon repressor [Symbiobacteriia bacterium]